VTNSKVGNGLTYSINGYLIKIRITKNPLLLVEGKNDLHFFERLFHEASKRGYKLPEPIHIDTAAMLQDEKMKGMGNREKVETVCRVVTQEIIGYKPFCGFVDREFRGFEIGTEIHDTICDHYVTDALIWSRGHSVENYYFDITSLRKPFELSSPIQIAHVETALNLFADIFESILHVSCAISLAARDTEYLSEAKVGLIKRCMDWKNLYISEMKINIDSAKWGKILQGTEKSEKFLQKYDYWQEFIATLDRNTLRWLCHGHIGFTMFWAAYFRCVYETCTKRQEEHERSRRVSQVQKLGEDMRFHLCSTNWAENALADEISYPLVVLEKLGIRTVY